MDLAGLYGAGKPGFVGVMLHTAHGCCEYEGIWKIISLNIWKRYLEMGSFGLSPQNKIDSFVAVKVCKRENLHISVHNRWLTAVED